MGWNGLSTPLGLFVIFLLMVVLYAQNDPPIPPNQDPCSLGLTFSVDFPENNPAQPEQIFRRISDKSDYNVTVTQESLGKDKNPGWLFNDYFSQPVYNSVLKFWSFTNKRAIDRDGLTYSVDDDTNILQYSIICIPINGGDRIFSILKIRMTDKNDNPPIFSSFIYAVSVNELTPISTIIYRGITVTDLDEGANKQTIFRLENSPGAKFPGNNTFNMPIEGESNVAVAQNLDFERMYRESGNNAALCYYNLTVIAQNLGTPIQTARATLIITISDGDDQGPVYVYSSCILSTEQFGKSCIRARYLSNLQPNNQQTLDLFTPDPVDGNNPNGKVNIIAQDRDTLNSSIIYSIARTNPAGYEAYFSVRSEQIGNTKQYKCSITYTPLNGGLNRNVVQSLDIILEAVENNFNQRRDAATISITLDQTNNVQPQVTPNSTTGYIYENSPPGALVLLNANTTTLLKLTFSYTNGASTDQQPQWIISVSDPTFVVTSEGYVYLASKTLDYEVKRQYPVTVTITDPAQQANKATANLVMCVLDANDVSPVFDIAGGYTRSIPEGNYPTPTPLLTVSAYDTDFGPVRYFKISVSPASANFAVSDIGEVSYQGDLKANIYIITVRGSDSGTPQRSTDTAVVVTVVPRSNGGLSIPASFYIIYVSEDVSVDSTLFIVQACGPDTNSASLTHTVLSETPLSALNYFRVEGNNVMNSRNFDRELISEYNVTIQLYDIQENTAEIVLTFKIMDVNDNSPKFGQQPYSLTVLENQPSGTAVGTVWATDADVPNTPNSLVVYSILPGLDSAQFTINQATGLIKSNAIFDYEKQKTYQIMVRASDSGTSPRFSIVAVTVSIKDLQDTPPLFEVMSVEVAVQENAAVNQVILRLPVSDADSIPSITLQIIKPDSSPLPFSIQKDGNCAIVIVNTALNYKIKNRYTFNVTTSDGLKSPGIPFTAVNVNVFVSN